MLFSLQDVPHAGVVRRFGRSGTAVPTLPQWCISGIWPEEADAGSPCWSNWCFCQCWPALETVGLFTPFFYLTWCPFNKLTMIHTDQDLLTLQYSMAAQRSKVNFPIMQLLEKPPNGVAYLPSMALPQGCHNVFLFLSITKEAGVQLRQSTGEGVDMRALRGQNGCAAGGRVMNGAPGLMGQNCSKPSPQAAFFSCLIKLNYSVYPRQSQLFIIIPIFNLDKKNAQVGVWHGKPLLPI